MKTILEQAEWPVYTQDEARQMHSILEDIHECLITRMAQKSKVGIWEIAWKRGLDVYLKELNGRLEERKGSS